MPDYTFENVWQGKTDALREEIISFWIENKALANRELGLGRVNEVVFVARDAAGAIVAVNTTYPQFNERLGHSFYYYRVFVTPAHRKGHVADRLTIAARDYFNERFAAGEEQDIIGLFAVVESPVLKEFATQAVRPSGFVFIGKDPQGNHLRVLYFDGARIR